MNAAQKAREDHARALMVPVGRRARSTLTGWECEVLEHVKRFEDGLEHKVRWDKNGVVGYVRKGRLVEIK